MSPAEARTRKPLHYLESILVVVICTLISLPFRTHIEITDFAMIYLFGVLMVSIRCRRSAAILSAILSVTAFDYFFLPVHNSFVIEDYTYIITLSAMLAVALVIT